MMRGDADQRPARRVTRAARRTFRSLRVRNYRLWFVGQTISLSGTWMLGHALEGAAARCEGLRRWRLAAPAL